MLARGTIKFALQSGAVYPTSAKQKDEDEDEEVEEEEERYFSILS